jgi:hypothetical protein
LEKLLLAALAAQGLAPAAGDDSPGALSAVGVATPAGRPELRAVTLRWSVPLCGEDALLTLLRAGPRGWRPVLEERSGKLGKISDGLAGLSLVLSPPDAKGESLALTADFAPWCTSSWSTGRYRIHRLPAKGRAALLLRDSMSIWMSDEAFKLAAGPGWVQLEAFTSHFVLEQHSRVALLRYALEGGKLRRLAPVASDATGFLGAWQALPWAEASRWSSPGLARLHGLLAKSHGRSDCYPALIERTRREGPDGQRWRLGLGLEGEGKQCGLPGKLFFEVSVKDGAFFLESAPAAPRDGAAWRSEE